MKQTELNPTKPFWAIIKSGDVNGYHTGTKGIKIHLVETDTAKEMSQILEDGSVSSGESMGDYLFKVVGCSFSYDHLDMMTKLEAEEEENLKAMNEGGDEE